ncbi:MAG TPA: trehalose-phosphatase [Anaerolineales bacterium]|nr:trehalose-phosphatase [Anaerolineales bacterium]
MASATRLWLFLDYDGTLAGFAPTPDHVEPDSEVLELLDHLVADPRIRVTVISGRRLSHVRSLIPVEGVMLAGTYGIELQTPSGRRIDRLDFNAVRPVLDRIKPEWKSQISEKPGFYLEDKGWSMAIHAKDAPNGEAATLLPRCRQIAEGFLARPGDRRATELPTGEVSIPPRRQTGGKSAGRVDFRILGGYKFLEIGPQLANKGKTVAYLIDHYPWLDALHVYIGDDDKDEEAFGTIHAQGGIAAVVASGDRESHADCRLTSPQEVRQWLRHLPGKVAAG